MGKKNVAQVRLPVSLRTGTRRGLEERLVLRFPRASVSLFRVVWRLPPRSRLRQAIVRRAVQLAVEAANRRDYDAAFGLFHPDFEMNPPKGVVALGSFPASVRGRRERVALEQKWREDWGEFRYEPKELFDLASGVLLIGRMVGSGPSSGATFDTEWADLLTISNGQVAREQVFFDRAEALEAAGLRE